MYKHILVAVDDDETSRLALAQAIELARLAGGTLTLIHAVDQSLLPTFSHGGTTLVDKTVVQDALLAEGRATLERAADTVRAAGLTPALHLAQSENRHAADQIAAAAAELHADLIVIGSHGRRGFQHLVLGSVAEKTIRRSTMSVLLVRNPPATP